MKEKTHHITHIELSLIALAAIAVFAAVSFATTYAHQKRTVAHDISQVDQAVRTYYTEHHAVPASLSSLRGLVPSTVARKLIENRTISKKQYFISIATIDTTAITLTYWNSSERVWDEKVWGIDVETHALFVDTHMAMCPQQKFSDCPLA